jgi:hypothetical protein
MNYPKWQHVTETDPKPDGIDFTLSKAERDIAVLAKLDILAMKAAQRGAFTPGLVVTELSSEDLTTEQRVALGLEDA